MKMRRVQFIAILALALSISTQLHAQEKTKENIWRTEYDNKIQNGLYALNAKNYEKAFDYLTQAAHWGSKEAQFYLAQMYLNGWGMEPDYEQGWLWLNVAMEQRTQKWLRAYRAIKKALPEDFQTAMAPQVEQHIEEFGAKAKDLRCRKQSVVGSNIKEIICEKRYY